MQHSFTAGLWNTLCLPFNYDLEGHQLDGKVYSMDNCTTDPVTGVTIYFSLADTIEAGKPYLVWAGQAMTSLSFDSVRFATFTPDTVVAPSGDVQFRAVMETMHINRKTSVYIGTGNRLYYASTTAYGGLGTRVRGFRGYFEIIDANGMVYTQPRVRVVLENTGSEILTTGDDAVAEPVIRKFIDKGILYIERDGVLYNAQGMKLD